MKAAVLGVITALVLVTGVPVATAAEPTKKSEITLTKKGKKKLGSIKKVRFTAQRGKRGPRGQRGPRGFTGPQGEVGAQGPAGPAGGFTNALVQIVNGPVVSVFDPVPGGQSVAVCPAGKKVLGGGWSVDAVFLITVRWSEPLPDGTGWRVFAQSDFGDGSFHAVAICA